MGAAPEMIGVVEEETMVMITIMTTTTTMTTITIMTMIRPVTVVGR